MSDDLKWLAENEHEWKEGAIKVCRDSGNTIWVFLGNPYPFRSISKSTWQAARDERSGKPGWELAPDGARIRVQQKDGRWFFSSAADAKPSKHGGWVIQGNGVWLDHQTFKGRVLGDWRNTLERRPVDIAIVPNSALDENTVAYDFTAAPLRQFALSQVRAAADCCITDDDVREVFMELVNTLVDEALAGVAGRVVK